MTRVRTPSNGYLTKVLKAVMKLARMRWLRVRRKSLLST